ncbi:MAG: tetratricopeptide repeat protein [Clostridia bacterium]
MENESCCNKNVPKNIQLPNIIAKVDSVLAKNDYAQAERILNYWLEEAVALWDFRGELGVLSELMGLYRKTNNPERGLKAVERGFDIIKEHNLGDLLSSATVYINGATALKAFGYPEKAIEFYLLAKKIYDEKLKENDFNFGALYNNMGLAYAEIGDKKTAKECFDKALEIMRQVENSDLEIAITYLNIADLLDINDTENENEISNLIEKAFECFDKDGIERDGYYAFVCSKCASGFLYYGYFAYGNELNKRAKEIYERN